jgi:NADP-dependent 3-hydroxy acid dehydrogenase YdfG
VFQCNILGESGLCSFVLPELMNNLFETLIKFASVRGKSILRLKICFRTTQIYVSVALN